jgi:hypothetical protein
MIRSLTNFVVMLGFTLMLPFFCFAAWGWGSADSAIHDLRARLRGDFPDAEVPHGGILKTPKRELTPAALYELFERHSQCIHDQSGKCPLLVFTRQMCDELNEFFNGEESEHTGRRKRNPSAGVAHEELE